MNGLLSALLLLLAQDAGAGPDRAARLTPPGPFHGSWRMTADGDRDDHGLMHLSIQMSAGEQNGTADYAAHQPFCSFLDGGPVTGMGECEIGGGLFDGVERKGRVLTLRFAPTADGLPHRIILRRQGDRLTGHYRTDDLDRRVILERSPE